MTAFGGFADSAAALALQPAGGFASEALSMGDALGGPAPHGFADFLAAAGGGMDCPVADFVCIPSADLEEVIAELRVDEAPLAPLQKGALVRALRGIFVGAGLPPPPLGSPLPSGGAPRLPAPTPGAAPTALATGPWTPQVPAGIPNPGDTVQLRQILDQSLTGTCASLTFAELSGCRAAYEQAAGGPPPEEHQPTGDQLAALRCILARPLGVPFADFAVWCPLGARIAKFRRTDAQVFVGGELVSKAIDGPATFDSWEASWQIFAVAMVSLGAATPGTMALYLAGVKALVKLMPARWPMVYATDLVMRSERWVRVREDIERYAALGAGGGMHSAMPWDLVIASCAYGSQAQAAWWQTNLLLPASLHVTCPATLGMPGGASGSSGGGGRSGPPAKRSRQAERNSSSSRGTDVCTNYNYRVGQCTGGGECPHGRLHLCNKCRGRHRVVDGICPGGPGHGGGQGGGHRGGSNRKGKGKGKDKDHQKDDKTAAA